MHEFLKVDTSAPHRNPELNTKKGLFRDTVSSALGTIINSERRRPRNVAPLHIEYYADTAMPFRRDDVLPNHVKICTASPRQWLRKVSPILSKVG